MSAKFIVNICVMFCIVFLPTYVGGNYVYTVYLYDGQMLYIFISFTIVNTTPLLKDLYQHFTPQYAADWKVIGTILDLPSGILDTIEDNNSMQKATRYCNAMLEKWLEVDPTASWSKLFTVVESPTVSCITSDKGMYSSCM